MEGLHVLAVQRCIVHGFEASFGPVKIREKAS